MKKLRIILLSLTLALAVLVVRESTVAPVIAADQRIQATEEMVGAGHVTKADTLNRLTLVDHNTDGTHKLSGFQAEMYAADAGASDTYVVTLSPIPAAYFNGMVVNFKANTVNTGAATLNVNSLGAKTIKKQYNVDLADGDIPAGGFVSVIYDGTNFQLIGPVPGSASVLVQVQYAVVNAVVTGNTAFPLDDTIPQNTEGTEFITCAITPKSASNILWIVASILPTYYEAANAGGVALFQDTAADALAAVSVSYGVSNSMHASSFTYKMVAGTTSETTFKVRGGTTSGAYGINTQYGGTTRIFGGVASTTLTIFEYTP